MHFHLPKPLHGWRAFVGEVGIIVIGVLIALGSEQMVEIIHARQDVEQLRGALQLELSDDRARWERMRAGDRCALGRLDAIQRWVTTAPATADLPPDTYRVMLWNMHSSAWDMAKTSTAIAHFPLKQRLLYASLYSATESWRQFLNDESENARSLSALLATADEPESRRQIRVHLFIARSLISRRALNYQYFFKRFDALGIKPDFSQQNLSVDPTDMCKALPGQ